MVSDLEDLTYEERLKEMQLTTLRERGDLVKWVGTTICQAVKLHCLISN